MAGLRKASSYSKRHVVPYTRTSRKKQKAYIKMIPPQKIVKFTMGREDLLRDGKLPYVLIMVSNEHAQIRHNALEACRQYLNKALVEELNDQFVLKVIPFPHHIQRENKMLTGAGADRMQTGMQLSFGKAIGKAAIVKPGTRIFVLSLPNQKAVTFTRHILHQIKAKLPCTTKILYEDNSRKKTEQVA